MFGRVLGMYEKQTVTHNKKFLYRQVCVYVCVYVCVLLSFRSSPCVVTFYVRFLVLCYCGKSISPTKLRSELSFELVHGRCGRRARCPLSRSLALSRFCVPSVAMNMISVFKHDGCGYR